MNINYTLLESIICRVLKRNDVYVMLFTVNGPCPAQMVVNHNIVVD